MTDTSLEPRQVGRRGRLPRRQLFNLKFAHEYFAAPLPEQATYPVDVTEGITDFGMQGNAEWSDCAEAGEVHIEMTTAAAAGAPITPDPNLAVERAQQFAGFGDTPPGPGTVLNEYLHDLYVAGIILGWVPVDATNAAVCDALMQAGFGLYIGVNLFDDNEPQFAAHQAMDAVAGQQPDLEEGHCVVLIAAAAPPGQGGPSKIITWAVGAVVTEAWRDACLHSNPNGEAYLVVTTEEQKALFSPQLFEDLAAIGGGDQPATPEPTTVPPVDPPVDPAPSPDPAPQPDPVDPPAPDVPPVIPTAESFIERLEAAVGKPIHEIVDLVENAAAKVETEVVDVVDEVLGRTPRYPTGDPATPPPSRY